MDPWTFWSYLLLFIQAAQGGRVRRRDWRAVGATPWWQTRNSSSSSPAIRRIYISVGTILRQTWRAEIVPGNPERRDLSRSQEMAEFVFWWINHKTGLSYCPVCTLCTRPEFVNNDDNFHKHASLHILSLSSPDERRNTNAKNRPQLVIKRGLSHSEHRGLRYADCLPSFCCHS